MLKSIISLSLFLLLACASTAQILPAEGRELHYRIIGFTFPEKQGTANYEIRIAKGTYHTEDAFIKNQIKTVRTKEHKTIIEVPAFGCAYTWMIVYSSGKATPTKSPLYHFTTGSIPAVDTNLFRLRITKNTLSTKNFYIFSDFNKTLNGSDGRPIWYLPLIEDKVVPAIDLKLSTKGTSITFIANDCAYEIDYDGKVLWKSPVNARISGDTIEHYHHEFTRLKNGHYMVMGYQQLQCHIHADSSISVVEDDKTLQLKTGPTVKILPFETIIEYDEAGNIVWSWKAAQYFQKSDLIHRKYAIGDKMDIHANAFYFNENKKTIYISFKNISRIVAIKYPDGTVIENIGELYLDGISEKGNGMFCNQHSVGQAADGTIFVLNNNCCNKSAYPTVEKIARSSSGTGKVKILWEYECRTDAKAPKGFITGGNVIELSDHSIFVSLPMPANNQLIVNMSKQILWSAETEQWDANAKKWNPYSQYRASIIEGRKKLESLIQFAETNNSSSSHPVSLAASIIKNTARKSVNKKAVVID